MPSYRQTEEGETEIVFPETSTSYKLRDDVYFDDIARPIPEEVVDKIGKANELEVFDNYAVLYFDPNGEIYKETEQQRAKRKDPILFGLISGSNKLYYVADWIDEYCDLTLEKFVDTLGTTKDALKIFKD